MYEWEAPTVPIRECELIRFVFEVDRVHVYAAVESPICVEQLELLPNQLEEVSYPSDSVKR